MKSSRSPPTIAGQGKGASRASPIGAKLTRGDLLRLALMASENRAAKTLGRSYPGGHESICPHHEP